MTFNPAFLAAAPRACAADWKSNSRHKYEGAAAGLLSDLISRSGPSKRLLIVIYTILCCFHSLLGIALPCHLGGFELFFGDPYYLYGTLHATNLRYLDVRVNGLGKLW